MTQRKPPVVAICVDGGDPAYFDDALEQGITPALARWKRDATWRIAQGAMPSFTNPNNVSIVTGVAPAAHGISGNHFRDANGEDVPMTSRSHLRVPTILESLAERGLRVVSVTAKQKLTELISAGERGIAFSIEQPGAVGASLGAGIPIDVYDPAASLAVLDAGIRAIERKVADVAYLSTTDYVQHKHAPGSSEARAFFAAIDQRLARFDELGAIVGVTADHGMNDKTREDGSPNVVYLGSILDRALERRVHVTLPITDPYVVHHGALGGCAMVYAADAQRARDVLAEVAGIERVLFREQAASELELPVDRIGDLVVLATKNAVLGKRPEEHDLTHVGRGLRSHGSLHERRVPFIVNRRVSDLPEPLFNRGLFDVLLNRIEG